MLMESSMGLQPAATFINYVCTIKITQNLGSYHMNNFTFNICCQTAVLSLVVIWNSGIILACTRKD